MKKKCFVVKAHTRSRKGKKFQVAKHVRCIDGGKLKHYKEILKIAQENPEGFTIYANSLEKVEKDWSVAFIDTQYSFGGADLEKVLLHALENEQIIGGWKDSGQFWFDSTQMIKDKAEAIKTGRKHDQKSIFNVGTFDYKKLRSNRPEERKLYKMVSNLSVFSKKEIEAQKLKALKV